MKIITRSMIIDFFIYIAEGALLFTFVFLLRNLYDLTDLFVAGGSTVFTTFQLLFSLLPSIMVISFPMAILLASLMLYGRMSQDNELTALQAGGYSAFQLIIPAIIVGIMITILLFWWSNRIAPKGLRALQTLAVEIMRETATTGIREGEFNQLGNFVFNPRSIENGTMKHLQLFEHRDARVAGVISAPSASINYIPETQALRLRMEKGILHQMPQDDRDVIVKFETMDFTIGIPQILKKIAKIGTSERRLSNKVLIEQGNQYYQSYLEEEDKSGVNPQFFLRQSREYEIERARRTAMPFACLLMAICGALLGMETRFGKRSACYMITIIIILVYYILMSFGQTFSEGGNLPANVGLWIPNIVVSLIILYLFYRTQRI